MTPSQKSFATAVSALTYANPFLPERIAAERAALGADFLDTPEVWSRSGDHERPNVVRLRERIESLAADLRAQMVAAGATPSASEKSLYADLVLYALYYRVWTLFDPQFKGDADAPMARRAPVYKQFAADYAYFFANRALAPADAPEHFFALFFQIRRAFHYIFQHIIGSSPPAAALRASVWQSVFTHDLAAYRAGLYARLGDIPTLITGPSGTGKELVARAIALSRYIPFNTAKVAFEDDPHALFFPLNLSALAPTLIESELFGHRKGSFTGALEDRTGYLELCPARGSVFLDEIGELDPQIQVKLLRVLEGRGFNRIGEGAARRFSGKLIAATHRDLAAEMRAGRFRHDLYYRLCADLIETPSLADQLQHASDPHAELMTMVGFIACKVVGEMQGEASERLTQTTVAFIEQRLGPGYGWPGNFRELEQCVRNILIRKSYRPASRTPAARSDAENLTAAFETGTLTADELLNFYAKQVYRQTGSYVATARRLKLDRRTIKARVDAP